MCWTGLQLEGQSPLLAVEVPWELHPAPSESSKGLFSCRFSLTAASSRKFFRYFRATIGGTGCLWSDSKALPDIQGISSIFNKYSTYSSSPEVIQVNPFHKMSHSKLNFCHHKMKISRVCIHCRKRNTVLPLHLHYSVDVDVHLISIIFHWSWLNWPRWKPPFQLPIWTYALPIILQICPPQTFDHSDSSSLPS